MLASTDAELVRVARNGNVSGFGELYRRHYAAAVGIAYCAIADRHLSTPWWKTVSATLEKG
jgi:hypothetical protein